jgi:monoterpene epsilon-lactone hydrolase
MTGCIPTERIGRPPDAELVYLRAALSRGWMVESLDSVAAEHGLSGVRVVEVAGVRCVHLASQSTPRYTLLYFHGGGYRLGTPEMCVRFVATLAGLTSADALIVDYRLAPEQPFPAALHDAAKVYDHLVASDGGRIIVGGDSAGAGLACSLVHFALGGGSPAPAGLFGISAWLDLTISAKSYETRAETDDLFSGAAARQAAAQYLQGVAASNMFASPVFGDVAGFPPALFMVGAGEVVLDDSIAFTRRLADAGVSVRLDVVAGVQHSWPVITPQSAAGRAAVRTVVEFFESCLR